ncbi:MAG: bifunctional GNAT family N-acetyltransferase/arsenate reductase [Gemmatimonadaceae bacterium]|nr:bifunctional GNAT family N-acetyltransferase/arsenate reductase [Gemmatimonadaceae bacterium]
MTTSVAGSPARELLSRHALRAATLDDRPALEALLRRAALPLEGVADILARAPDDVIVAAHRDAVDPAHALAGAAALEVRGEAALLRSVAVDVGLRATGLGSALVRDRMRSAVRRGLREAWLLTTTAADWFPRFGFVPATRDDAPSALRETVEFRSACPASATALRAALVPRHRILVLCTGNSARSQVAEALIATHGAVRAAGVVHAASAGSHPVARVNPGAIDVLARNGIAWDGGVPRTIDAVSQGAPFDLVITVCDDAREACPVLPGAASVHWGLPDPAHAGDDGTRARAFDATYAALAPRVAALLALPLAQLAPAALREAAQRIHDTLPQPPLA